MGKPEQMEMFSLEGARAARDEGIARVEHSSLEWIEHGLALIATLPSGYEGIGEDLRVELKMGRPPSSGAVGAMIRRAHTEGLLMPTGRMRSPRSKPSHARPTYVWRRV